MTSPVGRLAPAGMASIGAGAVHAAAIGVHGEHRRAAIAFALLATFQIGWGAVALTRTHPVLALGGAVGHAVAFAGFLLAKTSGIAMIDGLEAAEGVQLADGAAAALAALAVAISLTVAVASSARDQPARPMPRLLAPGAALAVVALAVPSMVAAGSHRHAGEHREGGHHEIDAGAGTAGDPIAAVPPKRYDPTKPIDLSGVPGVTPEQQARAENLIAITLVRLPRFADPATAEAAGFRSIGDGFTGHEHYINWAYLDDGRFLDPDHPESLVYRTYRDGRPRELVAAMFMLGSTDTLEDVPDLGGPLTQWHVHEDLCFTDEPGDHKVRGLTRPDGTCAPPLVEPAQGPMIHVWTVPHECGPFASLEGVAGGQIKAGEHRLCDHAHGAAGTAS